MTSYARSLRFGVQLAATFLVVAACSAASALEVEPFSPQRFEALQAENALVLVDVSAPWCSTCAKQKAVVEGFRQRNPDVALHVLNVDFDSQKEWVKVFKAPRQSTLILYRGREQRWFAVAETREDVIFAAIHAGAAP